MTIILDAEKMMTRSLAHPYLKEMLNFPDYYGNNLDALYDCLTDLGPTQIWIENEQKGGDFFRKILRVFKDAHRSNPDLVLLDERPLTWENADGEAQEDPAETNSDGEAAKDPAAEPGSGEETPEDAEVETAGESDDKTGLDGPEDGTDE